MAKTKFGPAQIGQPTPTWVKFTVIIIAVLLGGANGYISQSHYISNGAKAESMAIINYLLSSLLVIAPMFGIQLPNKSK